MSMQRKQLVRQAFDLLDTSRNGFVPMQKVIESYDPSSSHPSVISGTQTNEECIKEMLSIFEATAIGQGVVTWKQFLAYYKVIYFGWNMHIIFVYILTTHYCVLVLLYSYIYRIIFYYYIIGH